MLTSVNEIVEALTSYRPDQHAVILEMAANRNLDPETLTPADYKALLVEEAEFSLDIWYDQHSKYDPNDLAAARRYADDLKAIAERIGA